MQVVIVAHHTRDWRSLAGQVSADKVLLDEGWHGAWWNHRRALEYAASVSDRVWILEDDAVPATGFRELAASWCDRFPDALISGYLGRMRPPQWQQRIREAIRHCDADFIRLGQLIHGVCYSIPAFETSRVLQGMKPGPADFEIGRSWGGEVVYTLPSLVDHADQRTVESHPDGYPRIPGRVAWVPPKSLIRRGDEAVQSDGSRNRAHVSVVG